MHRTLSVCLIVTALTACSKSNEVTIVGGATGVGGTAGGSGSGAAAGANAGGSPASEGPGGQGAGGEAAAGASGAGGEPGQSVGGASGGSAPVGPAVPDCTMAVKPAFKEASGDMAPFGLLGGGCYFVDKTEVTWAAYQAFVDATKAAPPTPDEKCMWNSGQLDVDATCLMDAQNLNVTVMQGDTYPVVCVDLCDAEAFCTWAGKRLCNNDKDAWKNHNLPTHDLWYAACSGAGVHTYPYGQSPAKGVCNDPSRVDMSCATQMPCSAAPVGALQGCSDPEGRGITDMAGNIAEWTGGCELTQGAGDTCLTAGGSFLTNDAQCSSEQQLRRDARRAMVGFRCCADPMP